MSSSLIKDYKSKKACPQCEAYQLQTNDFEKAADAMSIHYHCLNCNIEFFEHPEQKKSRDRQEKMRHSSTSDLSLSNGVAVVLVLLATILFVNVVRQNDQHRSIFQPADQSEISN